MKKLFSVLSDKSIYMIYALGTVGLCWIGVWRDIGDGAQWALANNCVGFCLFPMILCRLKIKDFFAKPYYIWIIIWAFAFIPLYKLLAPGTDYDAQIWSALINLGLYGLITIRLYFYVFVEKKVNVKQLSVVFWLWLVMILLCIVSVNEAKWPLWYLVMFGALYLIQVDSTDFLKCVYGVTDGIIISFFWIQIRAFLYRPYDSGPSYIGHFTNANVNGMFYLLSLAAVLTKLWYFSHDKRDFLSNHGKIFKCILYVLSVAILDFVYFTGSRSAFLGVFGMIAVYLIAEFFVSEKKLARRLVACFCRGLIIVISFIVLLYPVYACARYIPALRHHPVWYRDYDENKVHSWDPIDSPKYTTFEMAVGGGLIQRAKSMLRISNYTEIDYSTLSYETIYYPSVGIQINVLDSIIMISTAIRTQDYPGGKWVLEYDDGVEPGTDENHWAFLVNKEGIYSIGYSQMPFPGERRYIWKYVIERLNFFGHPELYMQIYVDQCYGHAHNSFLQIGYCFGIIPGIIFLFLILSGIVYSFKTIACCSNDQNKSVNDNKTDNYPLFPYVLTLVFFTGFLVYGMFECLVLTGNFLFSCLFLMIGILSHKKQSSLVRGIR